jgi:hypothetical protein
MMTLKASAKLSHDRSREYHVGPIISWPFFGTHRGELIHPHELNRGPWSSSCSYFSSCAEREISGVIRENEGRSAPHRLHLDPDEILSSRHHRTRAVPGDESDESDEWDLEESEDEWEGPGDAMYRDYRRMQRSTFLVAHLSQREEQVRKEMARWTSLMERLKKLTVGDADEQFGLDCHDLSLENIFVDGEDNSKIVSQTLLFKVINLPLSLSLDMYYRLGIHNHSPALAMCPPPRFRSGQPLHRPALP